MTLGRQLVVAGIAASALVIARPAEGAGDAHFGGDDVRITVDEAGSAHVEHALTYRANGSPPKGFELTGVEPEAVIDPLARVALDGEATSGARVERKGERSLRITLDGLPRHVGSHASLVVHVSYTVDLVRARELTLDGAMWRLAWTSPDAAEGYDGARVIFDLPAAPTEPRSLAADGSVGDDGRVVTLRRGAQRDELEMVRPHVARGEAASWTARVDPRSFPRVDDPSLRPAVTQSPESVARARGVSMWLLAALAGILFGALVATKWARFGRACRARGVDGKGILALGSPAARGWLAGGAFAAGIACEALGFQVWGACAMAVAMVCATARTPRSQSAPRGPGRWLPLSPGEAFALEARADLFDGATLGGQATLLVAALVSLGLGFALRSFDPSLTAWIWIAPLDALALLPIFVTGCRTQLPPDRVRSPRRRLSSLHRVLKRDPALRVSPWARVPLGAAAPDELRLLVLPRAPMPGVVGIEVGVAWIATPAGYAPETEILVRVRESSAAAARLLALGPRRRQIPGRKPDERVVRLTPALPSRAGALSLVRRLAAELHDRRKSLPGLIWPGAERRLPPNPRLRAA